ncbi:MAG: 1-deoxy-D-xylulose-5-phosphate reductoisomerase [Victivallaceae bacterium]|nr:1-deoxy-D-xylulose-5-phosphate reductoisomerase [Victivallaceae bacterium]
MNCTACKNLVILGATGSVGRNGCRVAADSPERFHVRALVGNHDAQTLLGLAKQLHAGAALCCAVPEEKAQALELMGDPQVDLVLCAIAGLPALPFVLRALEHGKTVALASKEVLVAGGAFVQECARRGKGRIVPVDSEHSAVFQCLEGRNPDSVRKIHLTASGGALRDFPVEKMDHATVEEVLRHPNWSMGRKITVDSATMINKVLELAEAHHLFQFGMEKLGAVMHRESLVHALVEFTDGGTMALMADSDMRQPIAYALNYPEEGRVAYAALDFSRTMTLHFAPPDLKRYPALKLAPWVVEGKKGSGALLNAANDIAVELFLQKKIAFGAICAIVEEVISQVNFPEAENWEDLREIDRNGRAKALEIGQHFISQGL